MNNVLVENVAILTVGTKVRAVVGGSICNAEWHGTEGTFTGMVGAKMAAMLVSKVPSAYIKTYLGREVNFNIEKNHWQFEIVDTEWDTVENA